MSDDIKLDVKAMLIDLNNSMNKDFSKMEQDEIDNALSKIVYLEEKLVFNLLDWSLSNLHILSPAGIKHVNDIRLGLTSLSQEALKNIDATAPLVLEVVNKLDMIDTSRRLGDILMKAIAI